MNKEEFYAEAKKLVECAHEVYLSTFNNQFHSAETRAMANIRAKEIYPQNIWLFEDNDLSNFIITSYQSDKMEQIKDNKYISLYYYCPETKTSLTLFGKSEIVDELEIKHKLWKDEWKYYFKEGITDPDYAVIKFVPKTGKFYSKNLEKTVVEF